MKFLDGLKTLIGVVGTVVTVVLPKVSPAVVVAVGDHVFSVAQGVFGVLTLLGVIHKVEKKAEADKEAAKYSPNTRR